MFYAPAGGQVQAVRMSAGDPTGVALTHDGLAVVVRTTQLSPGEQVVIAYDVTTGSHQPGKPILRVTPPPQG